MTVLKKREELQNYCDKREMCIDCKAFALCKSKGRNKNFLFKVNGIYLLNDEFVDTVYKLIEELSSKRGRPKRTEACKNMNLVVPKDLYPEIKRAAEITSGGNVTLYINKLLKKDIAENGEKYKEIEKMREI